MSYIISDPDIQVDCNPRTQYGLVNLGERDLEEEFTTYECTVPKLAACTDYTLELYWIPQSYDIVDNTTHYYSDEATSATTPDCE